MWRSLVVVAVLACAAPAHAGTWHWAGPDDCPEGAVRSSLAARLETPVDALPFDVDVTIANDERGLTATLVIAGAMTDARTLSSASCGELADALAIVIARLVSVAPPPAPAPPPPAPAPPPPPPAIVEVAPVPVRPRVEPPPWNAGARISGIVGTGGAPLVGIAGDAGAWAAWRSLSLELAVSRWKSNTASVGDTSMAGVDVGLTSVAVRAGWRSSRDRRRAWLVGEVGSMRGTGVGIAESRGGSARWSAVGLGGAYGWPLAEHVALVAAVEAEFLIDHVAFTVDDGSVLYATPRLGLRAGLGIELGWR